MIAVSRQVLSAWDKGVWGSLQGPCCPTDPLMKRRKGPVMNGHSWSCHMGQGQTWEGIQDLLHLQSLLLPCAVSLHPSPSSPCPALEPQHGLAGEGWSWTSWGFSHFSQTKAVQVWDQIRLLQPPTAAFLSTFQGNKFLEKRIRGAGFQVQAHHYLSQLLVSRVIRGEATKPAHRRAP